MDCRKYAFAHRIVDIWNSLDEDTVDVIHWVGLKLVSTEFCTAEGLHSRLPSLLTNSLHWSTCIYIRIYWAFGIAIYILCIWCCVTILTSSHLLCFLLTLSSFDDHNELLSIQQCYEFQVHLNCLTSNTVSLTNVTSRLSGLLLFLNWGLSVQIVQGDSGVQTGRAVNSIIVWCYTGMILDWGCSPA